MKLMLHVLTFISMGDAHIETARLLGLCGLPNDIVQQSSPAPSPAMIEERVGPFIRELANHITKENLIEEVRLSMQADGNDYLL
jgi:hypothetical protein